MRILKIEKKNFQKTIKEAAEKIKKRKILICPTDTVYGLVGNAASREAVGKLLKIKKRPKEKALPIFIRDIKTAKKLAEINKKQEKLLKKFWPGKITFVLKKKAKAKIFGIGKKTIALRIPDYNLVNFLLRKTNLPLIGTSANISGKPASNRIKEIIKQFKSQKYQPDLIIDEGNLKPSKPSTIVDLTGKKIKILRKGAVRIK